MEYLAFVHCYSLQTNNPQIQYFSISIVLNTHSQFYSLKTYEKSSKNFHTFIEIVYKLVERSDLEAKPPRKKPRGKNTYNISGSVEKSAHKNVSSLIEYIPQKGAPEVVSK